jgi:peptidoglycan DL-endopeptidase LytE
MKPGSYLLVCAVLLLSCPHISGAHEIYTVKKGDTLCGIAKRFRVRPEFIKEANSLDAHRIRPGTKLTIPSKKQDVTKHSMKTTPSKEVRACDIREQRETVTQEKQYHTVKKGETLHSIATKYATKVEHLRELNSLKKTSSLKPGQQLIVKKTGARLYVVQKGDTLIKIAMRFEIDQHDLKEINQLRSDELKSGQRLHLDEPADLHGTAASYSTASLPDKNIHEEIKTLTESPELMSLTMKERLILFAKKMRDIPYKFGGSGFFGIDCSAYVQKVFGLLHIPLPRTAREQFNIGESILKEELSIGDLVFFRTYASFPSHVGIYLGNNLFIHASSKGRKVTIDSLETPYYSSRFIGGKRLIF